MGNKDSKHQALNQKKFEKLLTDPSKEKEMRKLFSMYDYDNSGTLDMDEFSCFAKNFLTHLQLESLVDIEPAKVAQYLYWIVDKDNSRSVDFKEFMAVLRAKDLQALAADIRTHHEQQTALEASFARGAVEKKQEEELAKKKKEEAAKQKQLEQQQDLMIADQIRRNEKEFVYVERLGREKLAAFQEKNKIDPELFTKDQDGHWTISASDRDEKVAPVVRALFAVQHCKELMAILSKVPFTLRTAEMHGIVGLITSKQWYGFGVPIDVTLSYRSLAEAYTAAQSSPNDAALQYFLAFMHEHGKTPDQKCNFAEARRLLQASAEQGYMPAVIYLATSLGDGDLGMRNAGFDVDHVAELKWLTQGHEQGNPIATYHLALMHGRKNQGAASGLKERNVYLKYKLLCQAASEGSFAAQRDLFVIVGHKGEAQLLQNFEATLTAHVKLASDISEFVPKDKERAMRIIQPSLDNEYFPSLYEIAFYNPNAEDDAEEARRKGRKPKPYENHKYLKQLALLGDLKHSCELGTGLSYKLFSREDYMDAELREDQYRDALKYFLRGVDYNRSKPYDNYSAQCLQYAGFIYLSGGFGVKQDREKGLAFCKLALETYQGQVPEKLERAVTKTDEFIEELKKVVQGLLDNDTFGRPVQYDYTPHYAKYNPASTSGKTYFHATTVTNAEKIQYGMM